MLVALLAALLPLFSPADAAPAEPFGVLLELGAPARGADAHHSAWPTGVWPTGAAFDPVRDSLATYYARQDTSGVERLFRRHAQTQEQKLLCRYRLFPMTLDDGYLDDIPSERGVTSARQLSLIAAMWAYKAANGPAWSLPRYGRRSERILNQALARDAEEPYALLIQGQSLLYKPRLFGGNASEAQATFEQLRTVLRSRRAPGIHPFEAEVWIWMAVRKQDRAEGARLQRRLLARNPPALFRTFLTDPPS